MDNKIHNNMIFPDDTKECPRCGGEMWEHENGLMECTKCSLWGWKATVIGDSENPTFKKSASN